MLARLYVTDAHCIVCFHNSLLFLLIFRALKCLEKLANFLDFLHIMDHEYIVFVKCDCLKLPHLTNFVNGSLFLETCWFLS
jgi:hypothetical protein